MKIELQLLFKILGMGDLLVLAAFEHTPLERAATK